MCFGEISFLNGQPRTADVSAEEDGHCQELRRADFDALCAEEPDTAIQLLLLLSGELGSRLVRTSSQLAVLEHL
jgi:CRP-like cAMP-binding protein